MSAKSFFEIGEGAKSGAIGIGIMAALVAVGYVAYKGLHLASAAVKAVTDLPYNLSPDATPATLTPEQIAEQTANTKAALAGQPLPYPGAIIPAADQVDKNNGIPTNDFSYMGL